MIDELPQRKLVNYIISRLSLDINNDLQGNPHICLLFEDEVISSVKLPEYRYD